MSLGIADFFRRFSRPTETTSVQPSAAPAVRTPVPDLEKDWTNRTLTKFFGSRAAQLSSAERQQLIGRVADAFRPRVSQLRNPFVRIARGMRSGETVVWENSSVMAVVPRFDFTNRKLLVVPKQPILFPTDASASLMGELNRTAAAVADAFAAVGGSRSARMVISTPDNMDVSHLHIHVSPGTIAGRVDDTFWNAMGRELTRRLG